MAEPAIRFLVGRPFDVEVAGPAFCRDLYAHLSLTVHPREAARRRARGAELAVLLKPSLSAAIQALPARRRVGQPTDHRRILLSRPVEERPGEHRAEGYLRVAAEAVDQRPAGPALPELPVDPGLHPALPEPPVLLLPGTRSAATVAWRGFPALARALRAAGLPVLAAGGPGDDAALGELGVPVLPHLPLPAFAALCLQARAIVGNDSGLPHLAAAARRAAGLDPGAVFVVYASTDPARTGPPGSRPWPGPRPPCWPCYAKRCAIGAPCREAALDGLLQALR